MKEMSHVPPRQRAAVLASVANRRRKADQRIAADLSTRRWVCIAPEDIMYLEELLRVAEMGAGGTARAAANRARELVFGTGK